jgi:hypothetical protein
MYIIDIFPKISLFSYIKDMFFFLFFCQKKFLLAAFAYEVKCR